MRDFHVIYTLPPIPSSFSPVPTELNFILDFCPLHEMKSTSSFLLFTESYSFCAINQHLSQTCLCVEVRYLKLVLSWARLFQRAYNKYRISHFWKLKVLHYWQAVQLQAFLCIAKCHWISSKIFSLGRQLRERFLWTASDWALRKNYSNHIRHRTVRIQSTFVTLLPVILFFRQGSVVKPHCFMTRNEYVKKNMSVLKPILNAQYRVRGASDAAKPSSPYPSNFHWKSLVLLQSRNTNRWSTYQFRTLPSRRS